MLLVMLWNQCPPWKLLGVHKYMLLKCRELMIHVQTRFNSPILSFAVVHCKAKLQHSVHIGNVNS